MWLCVDIRAWYIYLVAYIFVVVLCRRFVCALCLDLRRESPCVVYLRGLDLTVGSRMLCAFCLVCFRRVDLAALPRHNVCACVLMDHVACDTHVCLGLVIGPSLPARDTDLLRLLRLRLMCGLTHLCITLYRSAALRTDQVSHVYLEQILGPYRLRSVLLPIGFSSNSLPRAPSGPRAYFT